MDLEFASEVVELVRVESNFGWHFDGEVTGARGLRHVNQATFDSMVDDTISSDANNRHEFYAAVINAITDETVGVSEKHTLV